MKKSLIALAVLALTGCNATMSNRIACTVAKDKAFTVSEYGPLGVTQVVDAKDAAVICK
jgi:hypothetical protein